MDKDTLRKNDGRQDAPVYVAFKGNVYDLSKSPKWKDGQHMGRHQAGDDLTDFLPMAPHGTEVFESFDTVGELERSAEDLLMDRKEKLRDLYRKFHPHPVLIHYPIGVFFFSALLQAAFLLTGKHTYEAGAFYGLLFSTLMVFPPIAAGAFSWWVNYDMTLTRIFKNKITFSVLLVLISISATLIRALNPGLAVSDGAIFYLYSALLFSTVPVITFIAFNGGKITWPS